MERREKSSHLLTFANDPPTRLNILYQKGKKGWMKRKSAERACLERLISKGKKGKKTLRTPGRPEPREGTTKKGKYFNDSHGSPRGRCLVFSPGIKGGLGTW